MIQNRGTPGFRRPFLFFALQGQFVLRGKSALFMLLLALGLRTGTTAAQSTLSGKVIDANSGETLPGASIQIAGTYTGTITNQAGLFTLRVPSWPATIQVRFIGYQSAQVQWESAPEGDVTIQLEPSIIEMEGVTVTGEDPAIRIMRRVIEEKQRWRTGLDTYAVDAYNRFRMENDTGIVSIWESFTRAFWDREKGVREISQWQQQTRNMDISDLMPAAMFIQNLYDDDLEIAGHELRGVTNPNALDHYTFKLTGTRAIDDKLVYDISVEPKSRTGSGFVGTVSVLDGEFALLSVDLSPGQAFLFPPPVQQMTVHYKQQFSQFAGDPWLPVDMQSEINLKVGIGGILEFPTFRIRQLSRLSDFDINVALPDSLYEQDKAVVVDSSVVQAKVRPPELQGVPLTEAEVGAYATIDSTMTVEKAYKPTGLLSRFVDMESDGDGGGSSRSSSSGSGGRSYSLGAKGLGLKARPDLLFNRVEGLHVGGTLSINPERWIEVGGGITRQVTPGAWNWQTGIRLGRRYRVEVTWADGVRPTYGSNIRSRFLNSGNVLRGHPDYFNYYTRRGLEATFSTRRFIRHVDLEFGFLAEEHASTSANVTQLAFGIEPDPLPNPAVTPGSYRALRLRFEWEGDFIPWAIGPQEKATLEIEHGLPGDVAGDGFTVFRGSLFWRFDTFFSRRLLANNLDVRLAGQYSFGDVPIQKLGIVDGSTTLSTFGGLRTRLDRPYLGEKTVLLAWEHNFRTVPFELMHWDFPVRHHLGIIVHGAHGQSWLPDGVVGIAAMDESEGMHHEMGVSLSGLFTILRLDTTWRLDQPGFTVGVSLARLF